MPPEFWIVIAAAVNRAYACPIIRIIGVLQRDGVAAVECAGRENRVLEVMREVRMPVKELPKVG